MIERAAGEQIRLEVEVLEFTGKVRMGSGQLERGIRDLLDAAPSRLGE